MSSAARRLDQLLVIALEQAVAAPSCTVRLADAGARVIKIERAGGETARHYDSAVQGTSAYFAWLNRGKESVVLDVKASGDRTLLEQMISRADVFVQNLAPGAAERLDLGAAQLVKRYPRLVAMDIAGYARTRRFASCGPMTCSSRPKAACAPSLEPVSILARSECPLPTSAPA